MIAVCLLSGDSLSPSRPSLIAPAVARRSHTSPNPPPSWLTCGRPSSCDLQGQRPQLVKLDLSPKQAAVRDELLQHTYFPESPAQTLDDFDDMDKEDPIQAQIWKMYKTQKAQLPNKERMENLTWRLMNIRLRKQKQVKDMEENAVRYACHDL